MSTLCSLVTAKIKKTRRSSILRMVYIWNVSQTSDLTDSYQPSASTLQSTKNALQPQSHRSSGNLPHQRNEIIPLRHSTQQCLHLDLCRVEPRTVRFLRMPWRRTIYLWERRRHWPGLRRHRRIMAVGEAVEWELHCHCVHDIGLLRRWMRGIWTVLQLERPVDRVDTL